MRQMMAGVWGILAVFGVTYAIILANPLNWRYITLDEVAEQLASNGHERAAQRARPETMRVPGDPPSPR